MELILEIRSYFWSAFSCIWTEYVDLLRKSSYLARIQENTDQKLLRIWTLFRQRFFFFSYQAALWSKVAINVLNYHYNAKYLQSDSLK